MAVLVFLVIEFDIVYESLAEQFVALVHLDAERAQHTLGILGLLYNGRIPFILLVARIGKDGQIMLEQIGIGRELYHLRVDEDQLEL